MPYPYTDYTTRQIPVHLQNSRLIISLNSEPSPKESGFTNRHGLSVIIFLCGSCPTTKLANHNKYLIIIVFAVACHNMVLFCVTPVSPYDSTSLLILGIKSDVFTTTSTTANLATLTNSNWAYLGPQERVTQFTGSCQSLTDSKLLEGHVFLYQKRINNLHGHMVNLYCYCT